MVARTAHLNVVDSSGSATNTQALDCAGGTTLVVYSENSVNTAGDTTGATYAGAAMTEFARIARPSQNREIVGWYKHSPASGSNNIIVTRTTASGRFVISAFAYSGTDITATYTALDDYTQEANGTGTTALLDFANDGDDAVSGLGVFSAGDQTGGTDTTIVSTFDIVSDVENSTIPTPASATLQVTQTSSTWAFIGVALKEAAAAAARVRRNRMMTGIG